MAENEGFGGDHLREATSFSQLLLADDDGDVAAGLDVDNSFSYSSVFSSEKPPRMLCFGDYQHDRELVYPETTTTPQKSGVTCSDSSSASSSNNGGVNTLSKSVKKRNGSGPEFVTAVAVAGQRTSKKTKTETPGPAGHAKRKEKLGERITTLQQLVSPFGKTDTASVLHEAMGYIRFLHEQVQVLCSPYLQRLPSSSPHPAPGGVEGGGGGENGEDGRKDLRSRGLCLVPVESTSHVANSNGADFWSPAAMGSNAPSSTK